MKSSELLWLVVLSVEAEVSLSVEAEVSLSVEAEASEWEDQADENQAPEEELAKCTLLAAQAFAGLG